jgi:hypothetical protein
MREKAERVSARLDLALRSIEFDLMRRGIVLNLFARLRVVAASRDRRRLADAVFSLSRYTVPDQINHVCNTTLLRSWRG